MTRPWAPWASSARFAESLEARHARVASRAAPVSRAVLRGARPTMGVTRLEMRVAVGVSVPGLGPRSSGAPEARRGAPPHWGVYGARAADGDSNERTRRHANAERVVARAPIVLAPAPRRPESLPIGAVPLAAPVPRVVRSGAAAALARDGSSPRAEPARAPREAWGATQPRAATPGAATPLSRPELERITTHVVDALDRRIAAARERRGRI